MLLDAVLCEAARRLELVEVQGATIDDLAARHSISPAFLPAILDVLADAPAPAALTCEADAAATLLVDVIRRGTPLTTEELAAHPEARLWGLPPDLASSVAQAEEVAALAARHFATPGVFLDVGCGAGVCSAALFRATPNAAGILVDTASAIRQVWRLLAEYRMRFKLVAGDVRAVTIKHPLRVALVVNVLHTLGDEAPSVVAAAARHLEPGGTLVISGFTPQSSRGRRFALVTTLLSSTPLPVPDADDLRHWFDAAGLADPTTVESRLAGYVHTVARRP
ncbi:MAG: class I SAM-dependent methyltransferase [Kofleriaceae bacterium]